MITAHLKKLKRRIEINAEEERAIRGLVSETRRSPPDQIIIRSGEALSSSLLLLEGWLARDGSNLLNMGNVQLNGKRIFSGTAPTN